MLLLGVTVGGCDRSTPPVSRTSATSAPARDEFAIQFDSTVGSDSAALRGALVAFGDSVRLTHFQAIVDPFGGSPMRYLVFLVPPTTFNGGNVQFAVLASDGGDYSLKALFDTGVPFGPVGIAVQAIEDFDADGMRDVHFCDYRSRGSASPVSRIAGYRHGAWYEFSATDRARCDQAQR